MRYRKLKADKIFDGHRFLNDHVLIVQEDGTIENLVAEKEAGAGIETFAGIVTPGFINCHCHLELSHLKNLIPPQTGLVDFLISVVRKRDLMDGDKETAIAAAEKEMYLNGIVGVADICNTTDAIATKTNSKLKWHNLIELFNFYDNTLEESLNTYLSFLEEFHQHGLPAVLTPHAPYSISTKTYEALNDRTAGQIISIHNQETKGEDELFQKGSGDFLKLYTTFFDGKSPFAITGKSSLQTWLPHFTAGQTILLVHNTFITEEDILFAKDHAQKFNLKLVYCLCPNANLYIENRLPPVDLLLQHHCSIVVGTDSYSSNWQLNMAAEMKTINQSFPHISLETLLQWTTFNGAEAMRWDADLGSFKKGKKPGVMQLDEKDFSVKRIM
jgi:cytosine/adenosine deaminase-related metal-dependent hydrolase